VSGSGVSGADNPGDAWLTFLRAAAQGLGGGAATATDAEPGASAAADMAADMAAVWPRIGDAWLRACADLPGFAAVADADAAAAMPPPQQLAAPLRALLAELAATGSGPRDWLLRLAADWVQRQLGYWEQLARADATLDAATAAARLARCQAARDACAAHYAACLGRAAAALEARLDSAEAPIDSLRDYFDLWVDCFEREHALMLGDADFARDYAALLNSALLASSPVAESAADHDG